MDDEIHITTKIEIADFPDDEKTRLLGGLLAHYDDELASEVAGIAEIWADRREEADAGGVDGMQMGSRSPADFRRLKVAIEEHRAHLKGQGKRS